MRLDEPVQVAVTTVGGVLVAELVVDPRKPVLSLKTQLAGIEGTPVSNQVLLLKDTVLKDAVRLAEQAGAAEEGQSIHLVLVHRPPLLSGKLEAEDLGELLQEVATGKGTALERAIDAYAENPSYSTREVESIVAAVVAALLPHDEEAVSAALREADLEALSAQVDGSAASSRATCRAAFVQALRAALLGVQRRLQPCEAEQEQQDQLQEPTAEIARVEGTTEDSINQATHDQTLEPTREVETHSKPQVRREVAPHSPEPETRYPWKGAGSELQEKLHQRWSKTESPIR